MSVHAAGPIAAAVQRLRPRLPGSSALVLRSPRHRTGALTMMITMTLRATTRPHRIITAPTAAVRPPTASMAAIAHPAGKPRESLHSAGRLAAGGFFVFTLMVNASATGLDYFAPS